VSLGRIVNRLIRILRALSSYVGQRGSNTTPEVQIGTTNLLVRGDLNGPLGAYATPRGSYTAPSRVKYDPSELTTSTVDVVFEVALLLHIVLT